MKAVTKIAGAVAAVLVILCSPSFASLKTGAKFVPFSLKNVDGKDHTVTMEEGKLTLIVTETLAGEKQIIESHLAWVLVDFWTTWCVPCRKSITRVTKSHPAGGPGRFLGNLVRPLPQGHAAHAAAQRELQAGRQ